MAKTETIADRIRARMRDRGWVGADGEPNISRLQVESGLGYATAHELASGKTKLPNADTLTRVANALRVTVDWLLTGNDEPRTYVQGVEHAINEVDETLARLRDELSGAGHDPAGAIGREPSNHRSNSGHGAMDGGGGSGS